jgi:ATP-dependent Clp protease ATP-binding subunit ClpA
MISRDLEKAINFAIQEARDRRHEFFTLEHLLFALLHVPQTQDILKHCGGNVESIKDDLDKFLDEHFEKLPESIEDISPQQTLAIQRVLQRAAVHVQSSGHNEIEAANVLVSMFREKDSHSVYFLEKQGISRLDVVNYISHGISKISPGGPLEEEEATIGEGQQGREAKNPLDAFTDNLNKEAEEGRIDPLIGRTVEIERTIQVLCRRKKNNPLYIGDPGVGKTALAEGLALMIFEKKVPEVLLDATIYSLDMGALLANTKFRGEFEARLKSVVKALQKEQHAILFIDEIHTIVGAGATSGGSMDASNILKPALAAGKLRCMGSTTHEDYKASFEKDRALARRFQPIDVPEPTRAETYQILLGLRPKYEAHHKVVYTNESLKAAADLAAKHINHRHLPDKAIDVVDEVGASQRLLPQAERKEKIEVPDVEQVVARMAKIPPKSVSSSDRDRLKNLERDLKLVVYGQEDAIEVLNTSIIMARSGLRTENKPVGSFLFTGPTGVGKTEVATQLAKILGVEFIRFDMSEYMEAHTVSRLIGAPPGYVGFDQGGLLTDAVNKTPYAVILLDEIEKAHPDIYNVLLQVMDNATLTDHNGKKADFRNVVLIMTSNVGAREIAANSIGFGNDTATKSKGKQALEKRCSPEFRNRLDAIVPFNSLSPNVMDKVVDKFISDLDSQLIEKGVQLRLTSDARGFLAEEGYDRALGARPLARVIDQQIKQPLAKEILFGELAHGGQVLIDYNGEDLSFTYEKAEAPEETRETDKHEETV